MPVTSWTIASRSGRAVSSRWVRTCLSKSLPFSAGSDLTRCCSAAVKTPWGVRLVILVMVAFPWVPVAGGFAVPAMALINYGAYRSVDRRLALAV
jgi:hypothetical protein